MANPNVQQLRADLAANRARLVGATNEVAEAIKPQNIAKESVAQVKQFAKAEFDTATSSLRDERGQWNYEKLLVVGGAVVGAVVFFATLNSVAKRRAVSVAARRAAIER
ncbi:DUF3618 domain-containing protein [Tessaracoccus lacteus]|uniref:DUF3618 domain-containing protein n=1 Tax=Tessaracoccus lacteus TaxID=3041766 RepID=A0ABY8PVE9_9ACTN|nr:DUF3618 domain-containing protein [Tessaracoccus sp. T21]WGT46429.1 DUF3618 domain-containing protein [Tessaracoccus sp. T21]